MRHAHPSAGWGDEHDPGLDDAGHEQALAAAGQIARLTSPVPIYSSPLRRCQQTAEPLASLWNRRAEILPAFGEVPAPGRDAAERQRWLRKIVPGKWRDVQGLDHVSWRRSIIDALQSMKSEAVIYTHYVAINVVVGAALGTDDVVSFRPDYASVSCVEYAMGGAPALKVLELGRQADTAILARG